MRHDEGTEARVMARQGTIHRVTGETDVKVRLDLDGSGKCHASTGVPFLDHMLHQISSHGLIDLEINAVGDTHIDDHHTNEDVGIAVGQALALVEVVGKAAKALENDPDAGLALEALPELIDQLEAKMKEAAKKLDFEEAANLRDRVKQLRQKMAGSR